MADPLGITASIFTITNVSRKVVGLCFRYSVAVRDAQNDIKCLQEEVEGIKNFLKNIQKLLKRPDVAQPSTSEEFQGPLKTCLSKLKELERRLELSKKRKAISGFEVPLLRLPFTSKEVEKAINKLDRCRRAISQALQVDQITLILGIELKTYLEKLPTAKGASFDSHMEDHNARCLENTRVELQNQITEWVEKPHDKCILWLNGMARTGKSTIARTVAQSFADKRQLGASFFFKRGKGDRGHAARVFTTIAA
ncbi:hypothetical protein K469DRAFT_710047 [Zopfia rhizophila CBS 207.26]|uniref:Nephrocystin 3-like N-terminal domain-containing protein n=1 Tax=Zopfia rhizophila CBS 207.26 TaxID=1314779 RepID=A0A6A6DX27_9PEZI|nr:hypothetical protein K469DRAFT_710047 [Zopfia rhizophila CBS 207.26]